MKLKEIRNTVVGFIFLIAALYYLNDYNSSGQIEDYIGFMGALIIANVYFK